MNANLALCHRVVTHPEPKSRNYPKPKLPKSQISQNQNYPKPKTRGVSVLVSYRSVPKERNPLEGSGFLGTEPTWGFRVPGNGIHLRVPGSWERNPLEGSGFLGTEPTWGFRVPGNGTHSKVAGFRERNPKLTPLFMIINHFFRKQISLKFTSGGSLLGMYQYQNSPKTFGSWVFGFWYSFGFSDFGIVLGFRIWDLD
jgi:hypothetical protein